MSDRQLTASVRHNALLLVCLFTVATLWPACAAHAAPAAQGEAMLVVANRSTETICRLWLSVVTDSEWGPNRLGAETIAPGGTFTVTVPGESYDLLLARCDDSLLQQENGIDLREDYELVVTDTTIALAQCAAHSSQGTELLRSGRLVEAQRTLEVALACYRAAGDRAGEGLTLNDIGFLYRSQGRYAEAMAQYELSLAIRREVGDRWGEAVTLHNIGSIYQIEGRTDEALMQFEAALVILRALGDKAGEGTTRNNIGQVHITRGEYAEALAAYEAALALVREAGDRRVEANVMNNIGAVYSAQGRYDEALAQYQGVLAIAVDERLRMLEAGARLNIGSIYSAIGEPVEELEQYEAALAIAREVGDRGTEAQALRAIGSLYGRQERYGAAIDPLEAALAIARRAGDRGLEGEVLDSLGGVELRRGNFASALARYEEAAALFRKLGNQRGESSALIGIGAASGAMQREEQALEAYTRALQLARAAGDRYGEGVALNAIGLVLDSRGEFAAAQEALEDALAAAREQGNSLFEGRVLNNLGMLAYEQGQYAAALERYQAALAAVRAAGDLPGQWATLGNIGALFSTQDRPGDALPYYLDSIAILEQLRAGAGGDAARASFIGQYANAYDRAITTFLAVGRADDAFAMSERGRARAFLDSLATGQMEMSDTEGAGLLAAEQEFHSAQQAAQDALAKAKALNPPDEQLVADLQEQLAAAEEAHAAALAAIQVRQDQLASLVPGRNSGVLGVKEVQALLDEETTLVSYWLLGDEAKAFVLTSDSLEVVDLPEASSANITPTLASLYAWTNKENPHPRPLRSLHRWLVAPLEEHLDTPHVAIVPHQALHTLPFGALTDGKRYFGEKHVLTVLPSASALRFLQQNALGAEPAGAAATGGPPAGATRVSPPTRADPLAGVGDLRALVFGDPQTDIEGLPRLSAAEAEAEAIAELLDVKAYTGTAASEATLREVLSGTAILHLAAHGGYDSADPLSSLIALSPGGGEDGKLQTREIFGLPLRGSQLVVLSACETNVGALTGGDDVVGLTRAFFFAGAPSVLSSLWSVDDKATEVLMTSFYKHWLEEGMSKAEALQAAQAEVRASRKWASPFYWAAFTLNGDEG